MHPWENITLRICYIEVFPYIVSIGDGMTPKANEGSIFTNISKAMGLKWTRVPSPTSTWGVCDSNETCTGQLEPLQDGTADLALGPIIYTNEVFTSLRTPWPSYYSSIRIIAGFRDPYKTGDQFTVFNIYPNSVWYLILLCLVILPLSAWLFTEFSEHEIQITLAEHWSPFFEIILLESPSVRYSSNVLRCLFGGWMLASFVLSSYGHATLKSVMTVLTPERKIETLDDVFEFDTSAVTVRAFSGTGVFDMLVQSHFTPLNKLAAMVVKSNGMTNPMDASAEWMLRELETTKSLLIMSCDVAPTSLYWPPSLKLQGTLGYTYCSEASIGSFVSGWAAPKNVEFIYELIIDEFSKRILWLSESPFPLLLHYERESPLVTERHLQTKELTQPPPSPTSLSELSGTFILYGVLISSATVVFLIEIAANVLRSPCRNPREGQIE